MIEHDTPHLSAMGKKGAEHAQLNNASRKIDLEQAAIEAVEELNEAHLITEDGEDEMGGGKVSEQTFMHAIAAMRKRMHDLEQNGTK